MQKLEEIGELDRTLIVVTGDNGPGGFPRGKWGLYDFGVATPLVAWLPGGKGGRVVDDFVNLMDLAPTFLEVGAVMLPANMNGRSIMNILQSDQSGQIDPARTFVITGQERHVGMAREQSLPYPARALRTADFLYIRNFAPDRWPMGCPYITKSDPLLPWLYIDMDPGPTKDWLIANRNVSGFSRYSIWAFAKRPAEELYDVRKDPGQIKNLALDPAYATQKSQLATQLMDTLTSVGDPRVVGDGKAFDLPPYTDLKTVICESIPADYLPQ